MDNAFQELLDLGNRIKRRDRISLLVGLAGVVVTILLYGTVYFPLGIVICIGALISMVITSTRLGKRYRELYKQTMIDRVAGEYFTQYEYLPDKGFAKDYLRNFGIMSFGSDYNSEDMLKGVYNGVPFTRADVYIADTTTDSEGNSSTTVYFRGQWLEIVPNKAFDTDLQIIQKGFGFSNRKKSIFTRKQERRHVLETEDMEFNKRFQCLCQNDSEAFYLLTPALMQAIIHLSEILPYKMMIAYVNDSLQVLVDTHRDSMEPSSPKNGNFDRQIADLRQDMEIIVSVITGLLVDRDIYQAAGGYAGQ
ncbi:MAG: DUF3137 domain-containing protein [Lachnospiraceae bacterium]|nr:DUF3137 domain-containing protein [Lachnospiraceae bacterium]